MTANFEKGWTAEELERQYYIWLTNWIPGLRFAYSKLLLHLYATAFRVTLMADENRVSDGLSMRTRFIYESGLGVIERDMLKSVRPCSVLEVMIALALRFEEEYMARYETEDENPVEKWFVPMLDSLGIAGDINEVYETDIYRVDTILSVFLDRAYNPDGSGGLFYIPGCTEDMTNIELQRQIMMWNAYMGGN